jgi:hypothetical protein
MATATRAGVCVAGTREERAGSGRGGSGDASLISPSPSSDSELDDADSAAAAAGFVAGGRAGLLDVVAAIRFGVLAGGADLTGTGTGTGTRTRGVIVALPGSGPLVSGSALRGAARLGGYTVRAANAALPARRAAIPA